jgi:hypothetical protein
MSDLENALECKVGVKNVNRYLRKSHRGQNCTANSHHKIARENATNQTNQEQKYLFVYNVIFIQKQGKCFEKSLAISEQIFRLKFY